PTRAPTTPDSSRDFLSFSEILGDRPRPLSCRFSNSDGPKLAISRSSSIFLNGPLFCPLLYDEARGLDADAGAASSATGRVLMFTGEMINLLPEKLGSQRNRPRSAFPHVYFSSQGRSFGIRLVCLRLLGTLLLCGKSPRDTIPLINED